ncbi:Signal Peptide Peptidase-Like 2C [Manis pentadactyla]|nr:Signal Peptide Peptidase-Like 2C [Manis pentadactyla]
MGDSLGSSDNNENKGNDVDELTSVISDGATNESKIEQLSKPDDGDGHIDFPNLYEDKNALTAFAVCSSQNVFRSCDWYEFMSVTSKDIISENSVLRIPSRKLYVSWIPSMATTTKSTIYAVKEIMICTSNSFSASIRTYSTVFKLSPFLPRNELASYFTETGLQSFAKNKEKANLLHPVPCNLKQRSLGQSNS